MHRRWHPPLFEGRWRNCQINKRKQLSVDEANRIGDSLCIDWQQVDLEEFRQSLMGNHEQRTIDPETGLAHDGVLLSGQVVLSHAQQFPDYFDQLARLREEVDEYQSRRR